MKILTVDIETSTLEQLDNITKEKINDLEGDKQKEYINSLPLSPYTSEIICIGLKDYQTKQRWVLYNKKFDKENIQPFDENTKYLPYEETELFEKFWKFIKKKDYTHFLTFNGRDFDFPYLMLRSNLLNVKPSQDLLAGTDWNFQSYHIDLLRKLVLNRFNNGPTKRYSLDFYCNIFGIKSSKTNEVCGATLNYILKEGRINEILDYNCKDLDATEEVYDRVKENLLF